MRSAVDEGAGVRPRGARAPRAGGVRLMASVGLVVGVVMVALSAWLPRPTLDAWTASFRSAACLGACCVISDPFFEFSCGEYSRP